MRTVRAKDGIADEMRAGLAQIREQLHVPGEHPAEVRAAAAAAATKPLGAEHVDRTDVPFVTLDPQSSTDLDQAFAIERSGDDLVLRYAIADVGWFVQPGDPLDVEAWRRGETLYLPDGRAPLYPPALSEDAASLLPDGPRPAVVFIVRVDGEGGVVLDGVERAVVRSRAKLGYETVQPDQLPAGFDEIARRLQAAERARGANRIEPPEQEIEHLPGDGYRITFRPRTPAEDANSALSLATNLAVAAALLRARTGLFRVQPEPDERRVARLRHTAAAFGLTWPAQATLAQFTRTLDATSPAAAAFMMAVRRASGGADYQPYREGVVPWHAAVAATYAHATAPLRRLADRHVVLAALAVANGKQVPDEVHAAFEGVAEVMNRADAVAGQLDHAVIELAEAATLAGREGETFEAVVTDQDDRGLRIQLCDVAVVARVDSKPARPGDRVRVKLLTADVVARTTSFERVA